MKIGLVCPYNLFKGGGVQECVFALQQELTARGHESLIISPQPSNYEGPVPDYVRLLGRARDVKSPFHTTAQVSVSVDVEQVNRMLEDEKFDILHFHEPWVPLLSAQILSRSKSKNIATFHAKLPDSVMSRTIEKVVTPYTKSLLKYFSNMTAVSEPAAIYVRSLTDNHIEIIPNGIDLNKYVSSTNVTKNKNTIIFIGRLEKRKGLKFLLSAVKVLQLTNPKIRLLIAGDGPDKLQLQKYAIDNNINAKFLGRISEKDKIKYLHSSAIFCSPARYGESFGIVLLEAMAVGLPVVAGNNPGYQSVMKGTGAISIVDPSDTDEFARRLMLMIHDNNIRKVWNDWAGEEVKQYDYSLVVDSYEKLYKT